ncbi:hypothetical protein [Serratia liquefaciens]|uniref:Conjugal transfer entry exclusion protein TraS n=1 Tax=Serratia liquefaciens TaxID=614 RepID=A0A515D5V6_SERLI|nr:hypothetical protein [Serratia liquefaciens]QDL35789.1 hypothetical protein EGO53_28850 [Serratia liquefaciens]
MLTQKIIRQEIEELKAIMASDSLVVPSMWECAKPGVLILLWLFICPLLAFSLSNVILSEVASAVGFSTFMGVIIAFGITNGLGMVYAVPRDFREKSIVMMLIQRKVVKYSTVYMLTVFALALFGAFGIRDSFGYLMPLMFITGGFVFFFSADISRYKLSAFTEIVKAVKAQ